jgi:peptidyl-prolyl cis-trans isomerase B (cyclophilin B)
MVPARLAIALIVACAAAAALAACGGGDESSADTTPASTAGDSGTCAQVEAPAPGNERFKKPARVLDPGEPTIATVKTSCGEFRIELATKTSPRTANSFAFLAEHSFYDGTTFHRVAPGFAIQGGDPTGTGTGGPGYTVVEPPPERTVYRRGLVAMARTEIEPPGASGSQFFVVTAPADAGLPPDDAVLGKVTQGMDVVKAINDLGDPDTEQPSQTIVIDEVTIEAG